MSRLGIETEPGDLLQRLFAATVAAVDPAVSLARHLPDPTRGRTVVVGAGKGRGVDGASRRGGVAGREPFKSINPKSKVPIIVRDDGQVMTEYGAIATWLARTNPDKGLIPTDPDAELRGIEIMDYAIGTLHLQGFGRIFKTASYEPQDMLHQTLKLGQGSVKEQGREIIDQALAILDRQMAGRAYVAGDAFTIGDSALFYAERWAPQQGIPLPFNLAAHFDRMAARPAVARVRAIWGEA